MRLFLVLNILVTAVAWIQQRKTVRNTFVMSTKERVKTSSSFGSGTPSLSYSLTHSLTYSLTHSLTHSLAHSLTHSLTYSLTHSLTLLLTHSFAHTI